MIICVHTVEVQLWKSAKITDVYVSCGIMHDIGMPWRVLFSQAKQKSYDTLWPV